MYRLKFYRYNTYLNVILSFAIIFPIFIYVYFLIDPRNNNEFSVYGYFSQVFAAYLILFISFIATKSYQRIIITNENIILKGFRSTTTLSWDDVAYFYLSDGLYSNFYNFENINKTIKITFNIKKKNIHMLIELCNNNEIKCKMREIFFDKNVNK
jgi:hypothetical protein